MTTVLFYRDFRRFQGGHLKVFDYFRHVESSPAHRAVIRFTPESVWDETNPWLGHPAAVIDTDADPPSLGVRFLAGLDWRLVDPDERAVPSVPVINLIQHFRHLDAADERSTFLEHPAVRICVSEELAAAVETDGRANGPVIAIPAGIDLDELSDRSPLDERPIDVLVVAVKGPPAGTAVAELLSRPGLAVELLTTFVPRPAFLEQLARAKVTVLIPGQLEGVYLPPLEAMALGSVVVCPDCVGNRSFCRHGETCLVPEPTPPAMAQAALEALREPEAAGRLRTAATAEVRERDLVRERRRFLQVLDDVMAGAR